MAAKKVVKKAAPKKVASKAPKPPTTGRSGRVGPVEPKGGNPATKVQRFGEDWVVPNARNNARVAKDRKGTYVPATMAWSTKGNGGMVALISERGRGGKGSRDSVKPSVVPKPRSTKKK